MAKENIKRVTQEEISDSLDCLVEDGWPIIFHSNLGQCHDKWNPEYLSKKLENRTFSVHEAETTKLDFRIKNFEYKLYNGKDFIESCQKDEIPYLYLRAVGANFRKDKPNFFTDFHELSDDVIQSEIFPHQRTHSTILRISPKNMEIWLHYDTLDNFLFQVKGRKEVLLFDPKDYQNLYIDGDKSKITGLISDFERLRKSDEFCLLQNAKPYREILNPGDVLFIPALWFHTTKALDFSVSINNFFSTLDGKLYGKDLYGNRDPLPVEEAQKHIKKAIESLGKLPRRYQEFYAEKLNLKLE